MEPGEDYGIIYEDRQGRILRRSDLLGLEKQCTKCGEFWPLDAEFYHYRPSRDVYHSQCRACRAEYDSRRNNNSIERLRARYRRVADY